MSCVSVQCIAVCYAEALALPFCSQNPVITNIIIFFFSLCKAMSSRMVTLFPAPGVNHDLFSQISLVLLLLAVDILYIVM